MGLYAGKSLENSYSAINTVDPARTESGLIASCKANFLIFPLQTGHLIANGLRKAGIAAAKRWKIKCPQTNG
ncbi:hypothetical protein SDC9_74326 [bioreactor metagenome]|uniref:Uncharacterized protein n=1 Tax=bioreactor metagenome TaxID=1076179 RepID=A0A644YGS4_9ZZZZ